MPNHITNMLFITGESAVLEELKAKIYRMEKATEKSWNHEIGEEFPVMDFGGTVPFPKELEGTTSGSPNAIPEGEKARHAELMAKYGAVNWYEWNVKNWGTKWNAYDAEPIVTVEDGLKFTFNTAWSPPVAWLESTANLYPSLKLVDYYKDEGGGSGIITLHIEEDIAKDEEISDHAWYYQFDEGYKNEYDFITTGDYKEVIAKYSVETELDNSMLYRPLLDRIQDNELPLFIGFQWYGDDKTDFAGRLMGVKAKKKKPVAKLNPPKTVTKKTTRKIRWKENE